MAANITLTHMFACPFPAPHCLPLPFSPSKGLKYAELISPTLRKCGHSEIRTDGETTTTTTTTTKRRRQRRNDDDDDDDFEMEDAALRRR